MGQPVIIFRTMMLDPNMYQQYVIPYYVLYKMYIYWGYRLRVALEAVFTFVSTFRGKIAKSKSPQHGARSFFE